MSKRWHPTVSGEQEVTLSFTVTYEATGNCYYDKGRVSGPPEDCYPPEGECEIDHMSVIIWDSDGDQVPEDSDVGKMVMAALDKGSIEGALMETSPDDYRPDFERE